MKIAIQVLTIGALISVIVCLGILAHYGIYYGELLREKIPYYERLWQRGADNVNDITDSIVSFSKVMEPMSESFPGLVVSVADMNLAVQRMEVNVNNMSHSVGYMGQAVPAQMGVMNRQINNSMPWSSFMPFR
ncbi:MAG: hypothetical protein KC877_03755 [Candidatus Kaiserbacteria bacterium]|nr:hypothetical protein [Candidatus Kaiserbacteria bacterium]MCB9816142.1 hypothetical protein [Candidatus Nomurabacteria bacterium]